MTINERIKMIRAESGLSQQAFADRLHISKPSVQNYENQNYSKVIAESTIASICREFNINRVWLETGEGEMRQPDDEFDVLVRQLWPDASDRVVEFLRRVNDAPGGMDRLVDTLDSLFPYINKNPEA